jgi:hypothetical protein
VNGPTITILLQNQYRRFLSRIRVIFYDDGGLDSGLCIFRNDTIGTEFAKPMARNNNIRHA